MPRNLVVLFAAMILLGGCVSDNAGPRQSIGAMTGAVGGAFLGSQIGKGAGRVLATGAGTVAGMAVGADIGRSLDRANEIYTRQGPVGHSQQTPIPGFAAPPSAHNSWTASPIDNDRAGSTIRDARDCRALDDGGLRPSYACRNSVGQWFILR